jgi:hypothetical protein
LTLLGCLRPALVPQPGFGASSLLSIYDLIECARPPHIHPCGKTAKGGDPQRAVGATKIRRNADDDRWRCKTAKMATLGERLAVGAGCAEPSATASVPASAIPALAGQARVWFYRPLEPYGSLNLARIDVNGSYIGAVENGNACYRDVPPGHYHIAPESFGRDFNQDKDVDLAAGQQLYAR